MRWGLLVLGMPLLAQAGWTFDPALEVAAGEGVFHHLEASGRQAMAVSDGQVALTWEDDRSGAPRCYLAIKSAGHPSFREQAFGRGECYAPGIAALADGRFGLIWEDESGVGVALVKVGAIGPATTLADKGGQGALAWHATLGVTAVWSGSEGPRRRLWVGRLAVDNDRLAPAGKQPLEATPPQDDQLYPALTATASGVSLAWEDRRLGHTVIFASHSGDGLAWSTPLRVSHNPTGKAQGTDLGRGTGAMRPALAAMDGGQVATVWLDKRDFLSGYDVYAALPGQRKNTKVQDSFGDAIAQWHPAAASTPRGALMVAWDDDRDGTSDIWLSPLLPSGAFGEDFAPPAAAGPNAQTDPVLAYDEQGELHLAWVERESTGRSTLRYSRGRNISSP